MQLIGKGIQFKAAEAAVAMAELADRQRDCYRISDHADLKDRQRKIGHALHSSEFIYRVMKLNPMIWVEQQINFPGEWGFYKARRGEKVLVLGFPKGWMLEWTHARVDEKDLPTDKVHGWRQVLHALVAKRVLSMPAVLAEFGTPEGVNQGRWLKATRLFR